MFEQDVQVFKGIPFAAPPIGELRWKAPQYLADPGVINATEFANACMQDNGNSLWYQSIAQALDIDDTVVPMPTVSEDCLYLNVYAPSGLSASTNLPVMVWIHGGSNKNGWSYEPNYQAYTLAQQGVIVVSIAYRLGVFGYFAHPELIDQPHSTNFGLLDQVAALQWVVENIEAFGGNPNNITLFGESAGAANIGTLMASPLSNDLFHKVIRQSAGFELLNTVTEHELADMGEAFGTLDELKAMPADVLLDRAKTHYQDHYFDVVTNVASLPKPISQLIEEKAHLTLPMIIGTNADEWRMYLPAEITDRDVDSWLETRGIDRENARAQLPIDPLTALDTLETAERMRCPSLAQAAYNSRGAPTYIYYFDRIRDGLEDSLGAYHGAEIPYIFDRHDEWLPTEGSDRDLTRAMQQYWVSFAKQGEPIAGAFSPWPTFNSATATQLRLGDSIVAASVNAELCSALKQKEVSAHHSELEQ